MRLTFRPLDRWDWPSTPDDERRSKYTFKGADYNSTLALLEHELRMIGAETAVLMVDATERDCRIDGQLRADARPASPRVILAFDSEHGPLKYHCDRFETWQTNLRAIAHGLEALRKVERYGIGSRGEQYRGFTALPSGIALGPSTMSRRDAAELMIRTAGIEWYGDDFAGCVELLLAGIDSEQLSGAWRFAVKRAHPDQGGDVEAFKNLQLARTILTS